MPQTRVAIVGSGIVGTAVAHFLAARGYRVDVFEKGGPYPYPHAPQFQDRFLHGYDNPAYDAPADLQGLTLSGGYHRDLNGERHMIVGGSATHWGAITPRLRPNDFRTRTRYGFGADWPFGYDELEPYYCRAEALLGVSGTDADNPFAARRSRPYPLPPFALSYGDRRLAARLAARGITLHTTPQAATQGPYGDRPACENFGACDVCPIGARYSPHYHLLRTVAAGACTLHPDTSVRRIVADRTGRARALVVRPNDGGAEIEHPAQVIVVAGGTIENARLLLLSSRARAADGVPLSEHVGRHLTFHHLWTGRLTYREEFLPGEIGRFTGQSEQFLDPPGRGRHGGVKIEFSSNIVPPPERPVEGAATGGEILEILRPARAQRMLTLHSEAAPAPTSAVTLSQARDRFGDPYAHVEYALSAFDRETYRFGAGLFDRVAAATHAVGADLEPIESVYSGAHHMGTCRMGVGPRDSVVDAQGAVHGVPNLFVLGGSAFVGPGAVNPTLTMVALGIRAVDYITARFA
ncbi:MAG TPA: GMC family oxidoreductase [bacterium]|nr:GMC family oxidoreductase [bacterium]